MMQTHHENSRVVPETRLVAVLFTIAFPMVLIGFFVSWAALCAYRLYSQARQVVCPQTGSAAIVKLHAARAARTHLTGHPELRLKSCSRWPNPTCGHECLAQVRGTCPSRGSAFQRPAAKVLLSTYRKTA
jgi:hypothetical protein